MQATGDQTLRSRLSDRVCDILSCISAHDFCVHLLSLPSIQSSIAEGEWQRLELLAAQFDLRARERHPAAMPQGVRERGLRAGV